jgi:aprataxin
MKRKITSEPAATTSKRHWSANLLETMKDPESKIKEDDMIVVIKDKYPKARFHYLILPKEDILSIWYIKREHEGLLTHMYDVARDLTATYVDHEFM